MSKIDLKTSLSHLYAQRVGEISIVDVPPLAYLMVDGSGAPHRAVRGGRTDHPPAARHIASLGGQLGGRHHEIYLSDARQVEPAKMRTIIRQPFHAAG